MKIVFPQPTPVAPLVVSKGDYIRVDSTLFLIVDKVHEVGYTAINLEFDSIINRALFDTPREVFFFFKEKYGDDTELIKADKVTVTFN